MKEGLKIYTVDFEPVYPVPCCLVIVAESLAQAKEIAANELYHTDEFTVKEVEITAPQVIVFESGEY